MKNFDQLSINAIRVLGVEAINKAKSGHPGIVLGAAPIIYALFKDHLKFNPKNPYWFNRDRFVLSAGHGSALLYSTLFYAGYDYKIDDIKNFRQLNSKTPGHPEFDLDLGIEVSTGPLGQGIANGVGMALAESFLAEKYNQKDCTLIDHYTYVLCGDGDLQEGIAQEAVSFAGRFKLEKLIVLYDSNDVQLDSKTNVVISENVKQKFEACQWNYLKVENGNDYQEITKVIEQAKMSQKPTLIEVKTVIGYGATKQGTSAVHGAPILDDIKVLKQNLNWEENKEFVVNQEVIDYFQKPKVENGKKLETKWNEKLKYYQNHYRDMYQEIAKTLNGELFASYQWNKNNDFNEIINNEKPVATRVISGNILKVLSKNYPTLFGGSADLSASTKAMVYDEIYDFNNRKGRNLHYGVRELAMGAIVNGLTLHQGVIGFGSTFLVFSDYMKPALRLAALMKIPSLFIFSHDSIAVGEDGPTHEPIEQITMLRNIVNFNVLRPADARETVGAYKYALEAKNMPNAIILSRQDLPPIENSSVDSVANGGYVVSYETKNKPVDLVLIATGSEVHLAIAVQKLLNNDNINTRVVSMPSTNLFDLQSKEYQEQVLLEGVKRVSIELGIASHWYKYIGLSGLAISVDTYGASAPGDELLNYYGFSSEKVYQKIKNYLN